MKSKISTVHKVLLLATIPFGIYVGWMALQHDHYFFMVFMGFVVVRAVFKLWDNRKTSTKEDKTQ